MVRSKAMTLGSMFVLLVLSVALLPIIIRYISFVEPHYVISGFQDLNAANVEDTRNEVTATPTLSETAKLPIWRPDPLTDYVCRSPNGGSEPCPEGTFCDGASQSCVPLYMGGSVPSEGYYS